MKNSPTSCVRTAVVLLAAFGVAVAAEAAPAGPVPQVPAGGGPPGAFPNTTVSAVNVNARGSTTFNGNVEINSFEGAGPIPWTVTKYNRGDIAMRLAPANPANANANTLNKGFIDFTSADDASLAENQSWRPHAQLGVVIPTPIRNGPINWNDGEGPFYPTVGISASSSGRGYSMTDGVFGTGNLDVNLGRAGTHASSPEANFPFSVTWFPFDQGWIGGNAGNPTSEGRSTWAGTGEHAGGLAAGLVKWIEFPAGTATYGGLAELRLPGVNAATNGMIFATSSHGGSDVNIVGVAPTNDAATGSSYWIVTVREDSALGAEELAVAGQSQFEFVYVPFNSKNLVGGHVDGSSGAKLHSAGTFNIARTGTGTYEFSVPGKTGTNGTLLLQVADFEPGTSVPMASRAFLSYEYNSASGKFVIQSRRVTSDTVSDLVDASFYVVWVDFASPLAPPSGPLMRVVDATRVSDPAEIAPKEGNLAVNTDEPEVLVTTIDQFNGKGFVDPISGGLAQQALIGYFHNARTLQQTRGPFFIMGNAGGPITRHDVTYNPVSRQYIVVGNARTFDGATDWLMIARVNPNSVAGTNNEPLVNVFAFDGLTNNTSWDDVSVAAAKNGNFLVVAERKVTGEGEGAYGVLFSTNGTPLTPTPTRLDTLVGTGDEDDPDVAYFPQKDVFFYLSNTDLAGSPYTNRIVGKVIQTTAANNQLQVSGPEQLLADNSGPAQGHPASIENPFNGEIITAFDTGGNDQPTGQLSYYTLGAGPTYPISKARPQVPYLAGNGANPFRHQHPQLAVDPNSGVFMVGFQARSSSVGLPNGYVFRLLDRNGQPLGSQFGEPYYLADAPGSINTDPNVHNVEYSPQSRSFIVAYTANDPADPSNGNRTTYVASVAVTSSDLELPRLQVALSGSNVVLRWPKSATGFTLETNSNLGGGAWTPSPIPPVDDGDFLRVTWPATNSAFFRLRQ